MANFGVALEALKEGKRVARENWNGKGMFVFMRPADSIHISKVVNTEESLPQTVKSFFREDILDFNGEEISEDNLSTDDVVKFTAYLCLKAADGTIVNGWLASQTDMLSEDWVILD